MPPQHGHPYRGGDEIGRLVDKIEAGFRLHGASFQDGSTLTPMRLRPRTHTPLREVFHTLFITFRVRALLALALMMAQAFFYNAIFFYLRARSHEFL
jgi:hypothetical protein